MADANGDVTYFEPGVLAPPDVESAQRDLLSGRPTPTRMAVCSMTAGGFPDGAKVEKTLVLIKPDNFRFPNARPGGCDHFSAAHGLYIIRARCTDERGAGGGVFYGRCWRCSWTSSASARETAANLLEKEFASRSAPKVREKLRSARPITARNWEQSCEVHGRPEAERLLDRQAPRAGSQKVHRAVLP